MVLVEVVCCVEVFVAFGFVHDFVAPIIGSFIGFSCPPFNRFKVFGAGVVA